jgi:quercetin dioxygenase-like cupin family protein
MAGTTTLPHRTWNWTTIPRESLGSGVERQMIYGETLMICRLTFPPGTMTTAHRHVHEQLTIVERGRVRFTLGADERVFGPGDILLFPSGFWHGATMLDEEVVLLDIFSPIREDFLKPADATA